MGRRAPLVGVAVMALTVVGVLAGVPTAAAVPFTVTRFDDPLPDGCNPGDCSLREAIIAANDLPGPDTIPLGAGTFQVTIEGFGEQFSADGSLDIRDALTITGAGAGITTIAGAWTQGPETLFVVDNTSSLAVSGLTVRGGDGGTLAGGAFRVQNDSTLILSRVAVTDNESATGGGIGNFGTLEITDSTISGNTSVNAGGGIHTAGPATITASTIIGNFTTNSSAGYGGGLSSEGSAELTNVTVSGNSSTVHGGGIWNGQGGVSVNSSTVAGNTADSDADGSGDGGGVYDEGTLTLRNTIVAGNVDDSSEKAPDCDGFMAGFTSQGHNLIGNTTGCTFTSSTGDLLNVDPMLGPLADNGGRTVTHALLEGSPAIDAGGADAAPADQRGLPRNPDIGAYELVQCKGVPINRIGTADADTLTGTEGADGFLAQDGNDRVTGLGGNDAACLGAGNDRASGGGGRDTLLGEAGKDRLNGGGGKDLLICGPGKKETGKGGPGKDRAKKCEKGNA